MFELSVRLIGAGLVTLLTGLLAPEAFDVAWRAAIFFAAYSVVGYQLDLRQIKNAGIAGFIASADAMVIALLLSAAQLLDGFGFLVLAPCAYAAARYGSLPTAMAPLAASALLAASVLVESRNPSPVLLAQAGAVLALGLLLNHRRIVMTVTRPTEPSEPLAPREPDAFFELRESFRKLKDMYRSLESRARKDRLCRDLYETRLTSNGRFFERLSTRLREMTGAETVSLYTLASCSDAMVIRSTTGSGTEAIQSTTLAVDPSQAAIVVREKLEESIRAILPAESRGLYRAVLLNDSGKLVGMIHLGHPNRAKLEECQRAAEEVAPFVAGLIVEEQGSASIERRLRETEVLYEIAVTAEGAGTPTALAARVVRDLFSTLEVDHLATFWLDGHEAILAAHAGANVRFLESMQFEPGTGVSAWLALGANEMLIPNTADDSRCPVDRTVRTRTNSFGLVPIFDGDRPYGYLTIGSHRAGGIDVAEMETLRAIAAELGQAVSRLAHGAQAAHGLMAANEFQQYVTQSGGGYLVTLETLRKQSLYESFGKPAMELALRRLAVRLRARLPQRGALCRRLNGDFAVFLVGCDEAMARSWAAEATTLAAMVALRTPDGRSRIPLAVRSKVAPVTVQGGAKFDEVPA